MSRRGVSAKNEGVQEFWGGVCSPVPTVFQLFQVFFSLLQMKTYNRWISYEVHSLFVKMLLLRGTKRVDFSDHGGNVDINV